MKLFAQLYTELDRTTRTAAKLQALVAYLRAAAPEDAVWAVYFLLGRRPRRAVPAPKLRRWAAEEAGIPDWLFEASYEVVGDLAETVTLLLRPGSGDDRRRLKVWVEEHLLPVRELPEDRQRASVLAAWRMLDRRQRLVWNKLITGGFRVGVSQKLVTRALARFGGIDEAVIAHRLMGSWDPEPEFWRRLFSPRSADADISRPYPFCLAHPLDAAPESLGAVAEWQAEWKWDGLRAQLVRRQGRAFIWSRGGELVTDKFPEIREAGLKLPDGCVIDGEILAWKNGGPMNFAALQQRIGRKQPGVKIRLAVPVILMVYDLLEFNGDDLRPRELGRRSALLDDLIERIGDPRLLPSSRLPGAGWKELARFRQDARRKGVEGLMLKRRSSAYGVGRRRGDWWKWKVDPLSVDAVLTYAQRGHGRRAGLFTDYTFSVWDGDRLVPFAKAYSGLTAQEIRAVDRFVRANTVERFGPVRSVKPELVFEIAFEGIRRSPRHRSGFAVRFPRIARWRSDKAVAEADRIETIAALLNDLPAPHDDGGEGGKA
jgi:ATP-dependent DNA ligase